MDGFAMLEQRPTTRSSSDEELLAAWRDGDVRAGNRLLQRYVDSIHRYLGHRLGSLAEDALQDTLTACSASIRRFRGASTFRTYLYGIALNNVREARRRDRRHRRLEPIAGEPRAEDDEAPVLLQRRREADLLHVGLARMPAHVRDALHLYYWEGLSGPDMARALGIPENTARTRVRRGKQLLASMLAASERPTTAWAEPRAISGVGTGLDASVVTRARPPSAAG